MDKRILRENDIKFDSLHMIHDVEFGDGMPDPKPKYLKDLIERVTAESNKFEKQSHAILYVNKYFVEFSNKYDIIIS